MGTCEPGQVGNQAALNGALHVLWDNLSGDTCRSLPVTSMKLGRTMAKEKSSLQPAASPAGTHYKVLARRWRPQQFQDLVGQEAIAQALQGAIGAQRVAHAYLFTGARGVGKTTTARI